MKTIPLTQGYVAMVSDEDYPRLSKFKWCAHKNGNGKIYATRKLPQSEWRAGCPKQERLHEAVVGKAPVGYHVDHIDDNGLNNQRDNLRHVTYRHNATRRSRPQANNSSGMRGVFAHNGKWRAQITINGKLKHLGIFSTVEEAGAAYLAVWVPMIAALDARVSQQQAA